MLKTTRREKGAHAPHGQHHLEALGLRSGQDLLGEVAVGNRVAADELAAGRAGDGVEVLLVVGLELAGAVRQLGAQREAERARGRHDGRREGQGGGSEGRKTHGE